VHLGDFRFRLRRSEAVLPTLWKDGMEANKDWYRTASVGMRNFTPCFLNEDHTIVEGMQTCRKCNPYTTTLSPVVL